MSQKRFLCAGSSRGMHTASGTACSPLTPCPCRCGPSLCDLPQQSKEHPVWSSAVVWSRAACMLRAPGHAHAAKCIKRHVQPGAHGGIPLGQKPPRKCALPWWRVDDFGVALEAGHAAVWQGQGGQPPAGAGAVPARRGAPQVRPSLTSTSTTPRRATPACNASIVSVQGKDASTAQ